MRPYVRRGPALPWWSFFLWEIFCLGALVVFIAALLITAYLAGAMLLIGWGTSKRWPRQGEALLRWGRAIFRGMDAIMSVGRQAHR